MAIGPVELLADRFPGNQFKGEIVPAVQELVEGGTIRVIDILFVNKEAGGTVAMVDINDLVDDDFARFDRTIQDVTDMVTEDGVQYFAATLEPNSSMALMLFEHTWAARSGDRTREGQRWQRLDIPGYGSCP